MGKDMNGRDLLFRYFGQLELLDLRFPVNDQVCPRHAHTRAH